MKSKSKIIATLLCIAMVLMLIPGAVFAAPAPVCEINGTQYATLDEALAAVTNGQTITLLASIDYNQGISITDGRNIIFNLNGFNLNIASSGGVGLTVTNGSVGYTGAGEFNVSGANFGLNVNGSNASAAVTNATATFPGSCGANASNGGSITINNDVYGGYAGAFAFGANSNIVVSGDATGNDANSYGAYANGGTITIGGNAQGVLCGVSANGGSASATVTNATATSEGGNGAVATNGGDIIVNGNAQGGYNGVSVADTGSTAVVNGNATGTASDSSGARAGFGGSVTINGGTAQGVMYGAYANGSGSNITINGGDAIGTGLYSHGVHAEIDGTVHVTGNTQGTQYGVYSGDGTSVVVTGNATVTAELNGCGVDAESGGAIVIGGNVVANGSSLGAFVTSGGEITIDGAILASNYIKIFDDVAEVPVYKDGSAGSRTIPTTKAGYFTYSAGTGTVWVKEAAPATCTIDPIGNQTMTALTAGYASGTQETRTVTVTRTGTGDLINLAAALSGANASDFIISQPAVTTLNAGTPSTTFTVKAKNSLSAGTYTATVTVTADNMTDVTFTVTQVVGASPPTGSNIDLTWHAASGTNGAVAGNVSHVVSGANGTLVAINGSSNIISSTDGGQHWALCSGVTVNPNDLVYDGTNFIAAGNGIMTSSDGLNWTARAEGTVNWSSYTISALSTALTSKGWITVASGSHGLILVSTPGDYGTWQKLNIGNPNASEVYFGHRFSYVPAHTSGGFNIPEEFVGFGGGSIYKITPSTISDPTFSSVSPYSNATIQWFNNVWYENDVSMFYATTPLGSNDMVELRTSGNMSAWNLVGTHSTLNGSAANGAGTYVKVGNGGTILTSVDSTNWTSQNIGSANINDVVFAGGIFVAVGDNGTILTSADGTAWHICTSGTTSSLSSVAYANGTFVVSGNGIILQSGAEAANPLTITTGNLPSGTIGVSYSSTLNASGGVAPYSWSASGLPEGLIINSVTGEISGTPTATTIADIQFTVTDSTGASNSTNLQFIVGEAPAGSNSPAWPAGSTLTASGTTKTRTTLSWTAAEDDAGVTGYRIYQDNSLIQTVTGAVYSCEVTGLSSSTTYTFRVQAGDADNNWTDGPTVTVRTDSSGGGGGGGGSSTPAPTPEPQSAAQVLDSSGNLSKTVTIKLDNSTGAAKVEVDAASLISAFDKSATDDKGVKTVVVDIPEIDGAKAYEPILPASFLTAGDASKAVEIKTGIAAVTVPSNMLIAADAAGAQNVSLTIAAGDKNKLDAAVQAQIGDRPVIELNLKIDGKQTSWSNESAPVTVTVPYTPTSEELKDPEHITVWFIDGSGKAVAVPNGRYDRTTGKVTFSTTHFSKYAIVFVQKTFSDIAGYGWAKNQIEVLASKGIINGTSNDIFSPAANITRADYLVLLVKTLGLTAEFDSNFDDVEPGTYYYEAAGIAKKLGLAAGSGNNRFNPKENISRQDMMVLTARALEKYKGLKVAGDSAVLDKFSDKRDIAGYAVDSLATLVKEGLISGSGDKLNPRAQTTRAESAVFLYRIYK